MSSTGEENSVEDRIVQDVPEGRRMSRTPPMSTDNIIPHVMRHDDKCLQSHGPTRDERQGKEDVCVATDYGTQKPEASSVQGSMSGTVQDEFGSQLQHNEYIDIPTRGHRDYFAVKDLPEPNTTDLVQTIDSLSSGRALATCSTGYCSGYGSENGSPNSISSNSRNTSWKDLSTQTVIGPRFNPGSTRPTSVPNFQTKSISRRREGPDYPTYPDQSFKALQSQQYPPPYHPGSPHPLRTRSSHPSQNIPFSSNDVNDISDIPQTSSGAKTVGNTPAQSPGLFSPMFPNPKKSWAGESDSGRSSTPMLHPSHHKEPKE